jgi:hypothetical protein
VSLSNGNLLPSWLSYEDVSGIISGIPEANSTAETIMVTADDRRGGTVSTTFKITINTIKKASISFIAIIVVSCLIFAFIVGVVLVLCKKNVRCKKKTVINEDDDSYEEDDDICI